MKQLQEAVFSTWFDGRRTVTLQWNTSHYVAHMNRGTARRSVFCGVRPDVTYKESRWELIVSSEFEDCEWVCGLGKEVLGPG
jgi:hypothetical protein